ncbi:hypothetical protein GCM10011519_12340 [Marmoricola endophyticus]|uniref:Lipoprotein LpqN n=1 Tax=Marmoricola endophyticus TaxID=2040280 RepID=A0A917BEW0_9ACTN|nr:hypothetical protein [Marmoricola endophyticus]GGF40202.1 hypothetical protein GCM10011519_12340 [Marmoricola endophyticus]
MAVSPLPGKLVASALTGLLLATTVSACGGDDSKDDKDSKADASAPSYPEVKGTPATGDAVKANGYTYRLPKGWTVITSQLKAANPGIDSGGRATEPVSRFMSSINTITSPNEVQAGAPTTAQLKAVATQIRSELVPISPQVKQLSPVSVDGVPTVRQEGRASNETGPFYVMQYWLVSQGSSFGFTFAFPEDSSKADRDKVVTSVLSSVSVAS